MYHKPRMCRTCLQMSRGDFKFVSLDTVDPLWESNSPNLKEQILALVPEMKINGDGDVICTTCFIALRTGYEFKKMCQDTEIKFQNHNYKYRRPFGVGPGSAQFHVTLNETQKTDKNGSFNCQNIKFLQADTSIDITEHHLYDASKPATRKSILTNALTDCLPEVTLETVENKKPTENSTPPTTYKGKKRPQVARKKVTSLDIRKKYKIGSEISILKSDNKNGPKYELMIKVACETIELLKEKQVKPEGLSCFVGLPKIGDFSVEESNSYYFDKLPNLIPCLSCTQMFDTVYNLLSHEIEDHVAEQVTFACDRCQKDFVKKENYAKHISVYHASDVLAISKTKETGVENAQVSTRETTLTKEESAVKPEVKVEKKVAEGDEQTITTKDSKPIDTTSENEKPKILEKPINKVITSSKPTLETNKSVQELKPKAKKILEEKELDDILQSDDIENQLLEGDLKWDKLIGEKTEIRLKKDARNLPGEKSTNSSSGDDKKGESDDDSMGIDTGFGGDDSDEDSVENVPLASIADPNTKVTGNTKLATSNSNDSVETTSSDDKIDKGAASCKEKSSNAFWYKDQRYRRCLICRKICRNRYLLMQHCSVVHVPRILCAFPKTSVNETNSSVYKKPKTEIIEEPVKEEAKLRSLPSTSKLPSADITCNICDKILYYEEFIEIHKHIHIPFVTPPERSSQEEEEDIYSCYLCSKRFPKERFLKLHNKQVHLTRPTKCDTCEREFRSEFWYSRHKCQIPEKVEELPPSDSLLIEPYCALCNRHFTGLQYLKAHNARIHNAKKKAALEASKEHDLDESNDVPKENEEGGSAHVKVEVEVGKDELLTGVEEDVEEEEDDIDTDDDEEADSSVSAENITDVENEFLKSSASNYKRKSTDRMPKIQCDFCGELIDENIYDNHIYEHNKVRLTQKTRKPDSVCEKEEVPADVENVKATLKCHLCTKRFQRQYHLTNHINKHLNGTLISVEGEGDAVEYDGDRVEGEGDGVQPKIQLEVASNTEPNKANETTDNLVSSELIDNKENQQSEEPVVEAKIYECCGRRFRLKANMYRHYYAAHPLRVPRKNDSPELEEKLKKRSMTKLENDNENTTDTEDSIVRVKKRKRNSLTEDRPVRKYKKRKLKGDSLDDTREILKRKKIENDIDVLPVGNSKTDRDNSSSSEVDYEPKGALKYQCPQCDKSFRQVCQLRDHNHVHTGERPYQCNFCEPTKGFTQTSSLYVHYRRVHSDIIENCMWEPYSKSGNCLTCSQEFKKHALMYKHTKNYYLKKTFTCEICKKDSNMACHYFVHKIDPSVMMDIKLDDEPNVNRSIGDADETDTTKKRTLVHCTDCNKSFAKKRMLKFHKKSLAHFQQVQARKESNPSTSVTIMKGLANSVDNIIKTLNVMKTHRCTVCNATFPKKLYLRNHRREEHRKNRIYVKKVHEINEESVGAVSEEKVKKVKRLVSRRKTTEVAEGCVEEDLKIMKLSKRRKTLEVSELVPSSVESENESAAALNVVQTDGNLSDSTSVDLDVEKREDEPVDNVKEAVDDRLDDKKVEDERLDDKKVEDERVDFEKVDRLDNVREVADDCLDVARVEGDSSDVKKVEDDRLYDVQKVEHLDNVEKVEDGSLDNTKIESTTESEGNVASSEEVKSSVGAIVESEQKNRLEVGPPKEEEVLVRPCSNPSVECPKNILEKGGDDENILDYSVSDNELSNLVIKDVPERTDA